MSNLLIGIKRFFTNKNTVTIIAVVACICILYMFYTRRIEKDTNPVSVPYAVTEIGPRTQITPEMIAIRKVPGGVVGNGDVLRLRSQIEGKYVLYNHVIPKGSVFYASSITDDWETAQETLYENISDGNTLVSLPVTLESTYGNSIFPGNYIDLYFVGVEDGKLLLGKFIESIKVLGVIDSEGNNVFEKTSDKVNTPAYLVFSVPEYYYLLLQKASYLAGNIFPVPRNATYSSNPKETTISSAHIQKYIEDQAINVSDKDKVNGDGVTEFDPNNLNSNTTNEGGE